MHWRGSWGVVGVFPHDCRVFKRIFKTFVMKTFRESALFIDRVSGYIGRL